MGRRKINWLAIQWTPAHPFDIHEAFTFAQSSIAPFSLSEQSTTRAPLSGIRSGVAKTSPSDACRA
jgi:hypothetical protein